MAPLEPLPDAPEAGQSPPLRMQRTAMHEAITPVTLLGLGVVVLILALVVIAAQSQNRLALEAGRHLAGSALRVEAEQIGGYVRDYAFWNDAVTHLVESFDVPWADDNVGAWANDSLGMDVTLVVDGSDNPVFGTVDGEPQDAGLPSRISDELAVLIAAARTAAGAPGAVPGSATSYLEVDGTPAIAAAAVVKWEDDRPIPQSGGAPVVLIFMRRIDATMLQRFEDVFLLPGTLLAPASENLPDSVPLQALGGRTVTRLAWSGSRPGSTLVRELAPPLGGIAILAALLMFLIVRRARRSSAELASSHQQLQNQTRALWASTAAMQSALAEAAQANAAKSDFLARMSHELRTPLNAILGFSEIIALELYGPNSDPRYRDYGRMIHESGDHLRSLINDILDLSRIEAGRHELVDEIVELGPLIEQCLGLLGPRIEAKGLRIDYRPSRIRLTADTRALKQILLNLLSNAVKFTDAGGLISVRTTEGLGGMTIEVSDTGCGMSEDDLRHVFQLFGQARPTDTRDNEGSGLGLSITKALVEMHGGSLRLRSSVGIGTTATVWFAASRMLSSVPEAESA